MKFSFGFWVCFRNFLPTLWSIQVSFCCPTGCCSTLLGLTVFYCTSCYSCYSGEVSHGEALTRRWVGHWLFSSVSDLQGWEWLEWFSTSKGVSHRLQCRTQGWASERCNFRSWVPDYPPEMEREREAGSLLNRTTTWVIRNSVQWSWPCSSGHWLERSAHLFVVWTDHKNLTYLWSTNWN